MGNYVKCAVAILAVSLAVGEVGYTDRSVPGTTAPGAAEPGSGQDIMSVDRRVSTVEQRIYTLESNLNQLQQQIMALSRTAAQPTTASSDIQQLRLELQLLKSRTSEIECAMAKLDERTLTAGKPKSRSAIKDPCRLDPQTPIDIQGHPY